MSKVKATVGGLIAFGGPIAFGLLFGGLAYRYGMQHVHDVWWTVTKTGAPIHHINDYHHSAGGIIAATGGLVIAWIAVSFLCVLAGGTMIAKRNVRWD